MYAPLHESEHSLLFRSHSLLQVLSSGVVAQEINPVRRIDNKTVINCNFI